MAQHDYVIANGTGAAVRSDLNNALAAIVSQNSGATAPSPTYAYQWWADTTTGLLKLRNAANSGWITLFQLDGEWSTIALENGTAAAPSIYFKDSGTDTGFYSPGTDQVGISTGGTARLTIDSNGNVNIDSNTLYVDAANNRVGLGTSSPSARVHCANAGAAGLKVENTTASITGLFEAGSSNLDFGTLSNNNLDFYTNGSLRARLDTSGRLGIGTTSPSVILHTKASGEVARFESTASVASGAAFIRINDSSGDASYVGFSGNEGNAFNIQNIKSGPVTFATANTERARIDSSGRLLVGTSSSTGDYLFEVQGRVGASAGGSEIRLSRGETATQIGGNGSMLGRIWFTSGSDNGQGAHISAHADATWSSNDYPTRLVFSTTADGASSPTERMRITNEGNLILGGGAVETNGTVTVYPNNSNGAAQTVWNRASTTNTSTALKFANAGTAVGSITYTNTATAYNTSSDYRLKENVVPLAGAADRLNQLQVHRFNFIADPDATVDGFIAHEAQAVVPECVTGTKDEVDADGNPVYQGIDQSKLVPLLTAALQEALAEIESLKARLTAAGI